MSFGPPPAPEDHYTILPVFIRKLEVFLKSLLNVRHCELQVNGGALVATRDATPVAGGWSLQSWPPGGKWSRSPTGFECPKNDLSSHLQL